MNDAIARVELDFDGTVIDDFKSFEGKEVTRGKEVNYMNKTGYARMTPRFGFNLEYVVPAAGAYDFAKHQSKDAVVKVYFDGGSTHTYYGVRLLKEGAEKVDGENELVKTLEFTAARRDPA